MKSFLWVLLGIVIGVGGFYFATKIPESNVVKPDSPRNLTLLFKQAVDDNSLYSVQELMTPEQKNSFTSGDLRSIRQYIGVNTKAESGSSLNTYEAITFGNKKSITLWLVPPLEKNQMWQIQGITKGAR